MGTGIRVKLDSSESQQETDGHLLEHWTRCRAGPAQPEVEKEKTAPGPEAASFKPQASSRLKEDIIKK